MLTAKLRLPLHAYGLRPSTIGLKAFAKRRRLGHQRLCPPAEAFRSIPESLKTLVNNRHLTKDDAKATINALLDDPDPAQIAAFLVLLKVKGESADEIAGLAEALRDRAVSVHVPYDVVDLVGTGGDSIGSVNISTGAAIIAAAAGAKVAKHGNRSVSSQSGSADVLEALGVDIKLGPAELTHCIDQAGIGFMFAPIYNPHMKSIKTVRRSLKLSTVFNILGPMLNPAKAKYGLIGVYSRGLMNTMGEALSNISIKRAMVVHSMGLDELTPLGPADVLEVTHSGAKSYTIDPADFGIPRCDVTDIKGGDKDVNAQILLDVFGGQRNAVADALNLNAGFALATCGVVDNPKDGVALAREIQTSGRAQSTLEKWRIACVEAKQKKGVLAA